MLPRCFDLIAECLSMRHIILRRRRVPTVKYALCIYNIYLFIGLSGFTVQSMIVNGVTLLIMPGIQRVVYAKSSKVLAATIVVYCSLPNSR